MKEKQIKIFSDKLREEGYAVVILSPNKVGQKCDIYDLESIMLERAENFIEYSENNY